MSPLVSVCIPAYNAAKYIEETLKSITSQTWDDLEIIIGDNASTDNTKEVVEKYQNSYDNKIQYYRNETNLGYSGNCNKLIGKAKGKYICIFHSDDIYEKNLIERQVNLLEGECTVDAVFCLAKKFTDKVTSGKTNNKTTSIVINLFDYLDSLVNKNKSLLVCPSSMVRKSVYNKLGGYNTEINYIEDVDMWIRILMQSNIAIINEKLINYRISSNQGSSYYTSINRTEIRPAIRYLSKLFSKESALSMNFKKGLSELEAVDYIFLAKNNAQKGNYEKYSELIKLSRSSTELNVKYWKYAIVQHLPIFLSYWILNKKISTWPPCLCKK